MRHVLNRKYIHLIELQRKTVIETALGGHKEDWQTYYKGYALIRPLTGNEIVKAQQLTPNVTHRLYCDPMDIQHGDRLVHHQEKEAFHIRYPHNPMNRNVFFQVDMEPTAYEQSEV